MLTFEFDGEKYKSASGHKVIQEVMTEKRYQIYFKNFKWPWYMPKKQDFRDIVTNKMLAKTQQADGTYYETFRRINVYARK